VLPPCPACAFSQRSHKIQRSFARRRCLVYNCVAAAAAAAGGDDDDDDDGDACGRLWSLLPVEQCLCVAFSEATKLSEMELAEYARLHV